MIKHISLLSTVMILSLLLHAQSPTMVIPTSRKNISKILFNKSGSHVYYSISGLITSLNIGAKEISNVFKHTWTVRDFSISTDDKYLYSSDGKIQVWATDGKRIAKDFLKPTAVKKIKISPNNQYFTFSSKYNLSNVSFPDYKVQNLTVQPELITEIAYNNSGSLLAVGYGGGGLDIWNIHEESLISTYQDEMDRVTFLSFSMDDKYLFVGTETGTLVVWDIKRQKIIHELPGSGQSIIAIIQVTNYFVITVTKEGLIDTWEYQSGKRIKKLQTADKAIQCLAYCQEKKMIVLVGSNGDLVFYDIVGMLKLPSTTYYVLLDSVNTYVRTNLISWQNRGKYEKTEDYLDRVNNQNRDIKIEELTNKATNMFGLQLLKSKNSTLTYDPDNEYYQITPKDLTPIFVHVPIAEAPSFEKNYSRMAIQDMKFVLSDNRLIIQNVSFINPENTKTYRYSNSNPTTFSTADISLNFEDIKVNIPESEQVNLPSIIQKKIVVGMPDVDKDIPENSHLKKTKTYALVIGNEDYTTYQTNLGSEVTVDYAVNDAEVVSKYFEKTFGIPEKNIALLKNATYGQMMRAINKLEIISEISDGESELILYYSGHGLPDETTNEAFIMPVDASATTLESAISLNDIFQKLTTFPSKRVIAVIDACFSGGGRNQGLVAMKSVKIKPSAPSLKGNLVVLSSSTGEESSGVYREKQHGMFTYYFLKKLQESKGDIGMKELADYIQDKVELESVIINNKRQTPQVLYSPDVEGVWEMWRLVE